MFAEVWVTTRNGEPSWLGDGEKEIFAVTHLLAETLSKVRMAHLTGWYNSQVGI